MRQFVEIMKRLYKDGKVDENKIIELFQNDKISEQEKWEILNAH